MTLPMATTTITVTRPQPLDADTDPYDAVDEAPTTVATRVAATISAPKGDESTAGRSSQEIVRHRLVCETVDITNDDQVVDDQTGDVYEVVWARARTGLGLDHVVAELRQVAGVAR